MATIGAFVLLMAGVMAPAQEPNAVPDSGALIRTETKVVLVDTVVTDKKGNYVRNLTAKDFKVWEDNKEQTIKSFGFQSDPALPGGTPKRYIVLFFDNSTMDPGAQAQARQAAGKFIDSNAGPNRMMAIVNFGGTIQIAQNFTDDTARLKQIVSGVKIAAVASNSGAAVGQLSRAAADFGARDMLMALRSLSKNLNTVPGRKTLILFTAGFPLNAERISEITATVDTCNKSNVAVYPIDVRGLIAGAPAAALHTPFPGPFARAFGALLQPAAFTPGSPASPGMSFFQKSGGGTAGGAGAAGGGGRPGGAAPGGGTPGGTPGGATGSRGTTANPGAYNPNTSGGLNNMGALGPPSQARNILIPKMPETGIDNQNVMQMLADGTGGFVIRNTNDLFAGLEKIGKEMDEYYVLGYTPPESQEGACHALRVKVDQGGTTVRARSGYCNAKPRDLLAGNPIEKTLENRAAASQAGNVAASMQLPYFYTGPNVARVNVAMEIPSDVLKFEKQKGKFQAEMNVLGIAYNADGSVGARFSDTVKREFDDKKQVEAFQQAPFHYENEFEVASGQYNLKVVFSGTGSDGKSGASFGKVEQNLTIDPWANQFGLSGIALSKQTRQQAAMAQGLDASLIEDRVPLITEGVQVIPFGSSKFSKTEPVLFYAEIYEPLFQNADVKNKPQVGIQIRVLDRKTKDLKFSTGLMRLEFSDKGDNPTIPIAEKVPLDSIGAGQYTIELLARDTAGKLATRTADFDLE
jgi:VWFA-related protein